MSLWDEYLEIQDKYPGWNLKNGTTDTLSKEDATATMTVVKTSKGLYDWKRGRQTAVGVPGRMYVETTSLEEALRDVESPQANIV